MQQNARAYGNLLHELFRPIMEFGPYTILNRAYDKVEDPSENLVVAVDQSLGTLPEREQEAIKFRWGLEDGKKRTFADVGSLVYNVKTGTY